MTEARDSTPDWLVPALVAGVALPTFAAFAIGGNPRLGLAWAAVSVGFGLVLALGSRSETLRLLRGIDDDERARELEHQAMTVVALVLTIVLAGLFLVAGIQGESGLVYGLLLLLAEGAHVAALAVLSRRG